MVEATFMRQAWENAPPGNSSLLRVREIYRYRLRELFHEYTKQHGVIGGTLYWLGNGKSEAHRYARRFII